jgi:hypothetical protein
MVNLRRTGGFAYSGLSSALRSFPIVALDLPTGAVMSQGASFLAQVEASFDRAAVLTKHHPTLLGQIRQCNTVVQFSFPLRRDDGTLETIHAWRAEHSQHKKPYTVALR